MENVIPAVTLNSGSVMPVLGMDTAAHPFVEPEEAKLAILNSITDILIRLLFTNLKNLLLEYLDLYLIHFPISTKPAAGLVFPPPKDALLTNLYGQLWKSVKNLVLQGQLVSSNFSCKKLQTILDIANIPPAVNQMSSHFSFSSFFNNVEMTPVWQNLKLRDFCKANNIYLTAYSPLGARGTPWGSTAVYEERVLHEIAEAKGKTHAQVGLRWVYEQGVSLIVKSFNELRMKENMMIFDWELTEDELQKIGKIPQRRGLPGDSFVSEAASFKTVEEFWDGEV
ncbi:hypothetical protein MKX03_000347 [Papaver bracteatum]|nr:hypothetical protein MKX03_000347 [Papaver bracteatum]